MGGILIKLLKEISAKDLKENVFKAIGDEWMLITAGTMDKYNTMTASWGMMGVLWGRDVCACFIRPVRYTYEFVEKYILTTLSLRVLLILPLKKIIRIRIITGFI